jgi:hypothetical protein
VGKDAFDGAARLRLADSRRMDEVLWFLGECWKDTGLPEPVRFDNARELARWGLSARSLSRGIRLCLRSGVSPVFIPEGEPQCNASVENFNGWFQEPLFQQRFRRPDDLRRELVAAGGGQHPARPPPSGRQNAGGAAPAALVAPCPARKHRGHNLAAAAAICLTASKPGVQEEMANKPWARNVGTGPLEAAQAISHDA